jgi:uncharacterized protein YndB with AHSA1/START domain
MGSGMGTRNTWAFVVLSLALAGGAPAEAKDRVLRAEVDLAATPAEVWKAWTTAEGIATFFAPAGQVDLRVDGTYDVWFNPSGPPGQRGAEGMRILDVDAPRRFAFTWNAPPTIPAIRGRRNVVILDLAPLDGSRTRLRFTQLGWGDGAEWDQAYDYFDHAWNAVVFPRLVRRFETGPIDWKAVPELAPVAKSLKVTLGEAEGPRARP